ncbi:ABC transporter substrate-binding protein [Flexivirga endophytica]|uniref:ABC transporter substrate-binding protein n=1 Tax=Flexivirga endophytica TaxID=1849103 RepID=A0A916T3X2_9MICO|nr:ABC transporter substrate-binding protein [Flexivirga endophytica]GGB28280.1 ABC transporter substrate-binding protein [Flexivirga endophytica]GHB62056.1 ABC transporter substrate-binding protein [Flexivirga endophytica]
MTSPRRLAACVSAVLAGAVLVAGCGARPLSDLHKSEAAAATALTSQDASKLDPSAKTINSIAPDKKLAKLVPTSVRKNGLQFSTSQGYPPMELFASDGSTIIGVDPSIGWAIARVLGLKITINDADFNAQIPGVLTGRYDIVMSSMSDTKERQQKVSFVDYVQAGAAMQVRKGNPDRLSGPSDLCGRTVSVVDNGSSLAVAEGYNKDCVKAGKRKIKILRFTGDQDALLALKSGRANTNITDYVVAASHAADPKQKLDVVPLKGTESLWGIAMNPAEKKLISAVQGALNKLIANGKYHQILAAYNMKELAVKKATINGGSE